MSGIIVVTPVLLAAPVVMAAATSAAAALGFTMATQKADATAQAKAEDKVVGFDIEEADGLKQLLCDQGALVFTREDATVVLREKNQGVHMEVRGQAEEAELEALGRNLLQTVTQHYAYDRVVSELKERGFDNVEENQEEDGTIRLRLRRWDS